MPRSQSSRGGSLAQIYDTQGQRFQPNAELEDERIILEHEMGQLLFSEAFEVGIIRLESLAVAQNTTFGVVTTTQVSRSPFRVLDFIVFSEDAAAVTDIAHAALLFRDSSIAVQAECPFFMWENDGGTSLTFEGDDTLGVGQVIALNKDTRVTNWNQLIMQGTAQQTGDRGGSDLALRGRTGAFGAGTINIRANIIIASADKPGSLSSRGLPIPSW